MDFKGRTISREHRDQNGSHLSTPQWIRFILTTCLGLLLTVAAFLTVRDVHAQEHLLEFERASVNRFSTVRRSINNTLGEVEEVGAFMAALNDPTPKKKSSPS